MQPQEAPTAQARKVCQAAAIHILHGEDALPRELRAGRPRHPPCPPHMKQLFCTVSPSSMRQLTSSGGGLLSHLGNRGRHSGPAVPGKRSAQPRRILCLMPAQHAMSLSDSPQAGVTGVMQQLEPVAPRRWTTNCKTPQAAPALLCLI